MGLCMFCIHYHLLRIIARQELCFGIFLVSLSNSIFNSRLRMDTCVGSLYPLISNAGTPDCTFGAFCWRSCDVRIHFLKDDYRYEETTRDALRPRASHIGSAP